MGNSTYALVFILLVNGLMLMAQFGMISTALEEGAVSSSCYNPDGGIFSKLATNINDPDGITYTNNVSSSLIQEQEGIISGTVSFFTDTINVILKWVKTVGSYFLLITTSPIIILNSCLGVPSYFAVIVGAIWYGISLFVIISYIKGGGD